MHVAMSDDKGCIPGAVIGWNIVEVKRIVKQSLPVILAKHM